MTATAPQLDTAALPPRLAQRLEALGVAVVCAAPDGHVTLLGPTQPVEQLVVESAPFAAALRRHWATLTAGQSPIHTLGPGLALVPLPVARRRRLPSDRPAAPFFAALLLGPELLTSEEFHAVCDDRQVDHQATVAAVDVASLLSAGEAQRLAAMLTWMLEDTLENGRRSHELRTLTQQLGESYEELSLLYKLSTSMTVDQPPAAFLTEACRELQQVLGLRWMALQLIDGEPRLNELAGLVFTAGPLECDAALLKRMGRALLQQLSESAGPVVVDDTQTLHIPYLPRLARSLLLVSLKREERPLGILFGGDKLDGSHISSVDSKLCNSLASSLSMFLENMMLFEDMQAMFLGTLHALTSAIDAKDNYTHGHSDRVALLSRQLAAAAGLDAHAVERVYLSALMHDVGKIGVPESVLCKAGKLTDEEFAVIKMHPEIGARILQDIRQMHDLIPGVLHHHERWDGTGYPYGLAGQDIPIFGRVVCLADSFDAMSSTRKYRPSLTDDRVLSEIRHCRGTQFDPHLADVFLDLDFAPFFRMVQEHQQQHVGPIQATVRLGPGGSQIEARHSTPPPSAGAAGRDGGGP